MYCKWYQLSIANNINVLIYILAQCGAACKPILWTDAKSTGVKYDIKLANWVMQEVLFEKVYILPMVQTL